jgi:hypothetical protein
MGHKPKRTQPTNLLNTKLLLRNAISTTGHLLVIIVAEKVGPEQNCLGVLKKYADTPGLVVQFLTNAFELSW